MSDYTQTSGNGSELPYDLIGSNVKLLDFALPRCRFLRQTWLKSATVHMYMCMNSFGK